MVGDGHEVQWAVEVVATPELRELDVLSPSEIIGLLMGGGGALEGCVQRHVGVDVQIAEERLSGGGGIRAGCMCGEGQQDDDEHGFPRVR